jgi:phospholipase D1/2
VQRAAVNDFLKSSIYRAYLNLIEKSEHFIYIENQFFSMNSWFSVMYANVYQKSRLRKGVTLLRIESERFEKVLHFNNTCCNKSLKAILNRIIRAWNEKKKFRVYILMPLLPAFEGTAKLNSENGIDVLYRCHK